MVRGKTQMRRIENATSRQVTFSKRRNGILKKAFELSVLCEADVALIIFSPKGKLHEFSNTSIQAIIERYKKHTKDNQNLNKCIDQRTQQMKQEAAAMTKKIELLEISRRKLLGYDLATCSVEELQLVQQQLEKSVTKIRARKKQAFKEEVERLQEKESLLKAEYTRLSEKCKKLQGLSNNVEIFNTPNTDIINSPNNLDVETTLFIGPPESRQNRRA